MGLALRLQLSESRLLLGFCIRRSAKLLAKGMLGTPQTGTFTSHLHRRLESESPDKCPSCDSLVSVLMLEASVPVVGLFRDVPYISVWEFLFKMALHRSAEVPTPRAQKKRGRTLVS